MKQSRIIYVFLFKILNSIPKGEHRDMIAKLKDEQKRKLAILASRYETTIESMVQNQTVKLESWQVCCLLINFNPFLSKKLFIYFLHTDFSPKHFSFHFHHFIAWHSIHTACCFQEDEAKSLNEKLEKELSMLKAFQTKQRTDLESTCDREQKQLKESVTSRRNLLEEKVCFIILESFD